MFIPSQSQFDQSCKKKPTDTNINPRIIDAILAYLAKKEEKAFLEYTSA